MTKRRAAPQPDSEGGAQMLFVTLIILLSLVALSIPVAAALGILGLTLDQVYAPFPLYRAAGEIFWSVGTDFILAAIPMFILLGELLLRSGISTRMYSSIELWLGRMPGGLMHSNIAASALFAATSGSSVATAATVGTVAIPEGQRNGYNERLFLGTLAAGGTLGILIPPSINLIIYGVLTETSVPQLYLAGIFPGLALAGLFMATVAISCFLFPKWGGRTGQSGFMDRLRALKHLVPPLGIFLIVVGSIYAGFATPTEAAALGVMAALGLAAYHRRLNWQILRETLLGTMRTTAMVMLIILMAYFLNFILSAIGLTQQLTDFIASMGLTPFTTLLVIVAFYLIIGCFMETLSMMIATVPIIAPIIISLGYDPVWFGVLLMLLLETALITPPIGVNLYVVQGVRGRGAITDVIIGTLPFIATMFVMIALLLAWPGMATWLPQQFY
ncbi:TRAP transporter large permease [Aestuariispira insulae]|uniref:TRAP transporter large permease n=1 Tax=Aestuariispira insulae TaxID=1461337 RepID=UPI001FEB6B41|nr:TRAP transporter large permease [Aestuariispira insulae]